MSGGKRVRNSGDNGEWMTEARRSEHNEELKIRNVKTNERRCIIGMRQASGSKEKRLKIWRCARSLGGDVKRKQEKGAEGEVMGNMKNKKGRRRRRREKEGESDGKCVRVQ